eukprot:Skav200798  [mRNA]  locus=scaffold959:16814:23522:+ [translate_table: standard]
MRTLCDGKKAKDRVQWLVEHQQMTMEVDRPVASCSALGGDIEPNPPQWPETVKILPQGADYGVVDKIYEDSMGWGCDGEEMKSLDEGGHLTYTLDGEGGMLWAVSQAAPLRRVIVPRPKRYPKQGVALDYDGWVKLGYTDPIGDFASAWAALLSLDLVLRSREF